MRIIAVIFAFGPLAVAGCGEVSVERAATNAALAAVEASNPEIVQGIRAARTLRQAAATCGWRDVDAEALARAAVGGIEEPPLRAAASSLVQDLLVSDSSSDAAAATPSQCSPEVRQALESQIAAMSQGESESEAG